MASTPDIAVRIRTEGIIAAQNAFRSLQASAKGSFGFLERAGNQARSAFKFLEKPFRLTIDGIEKITHTTALVGGLAAALALVEGAKDVEAGNVLNGMRQGLRVALDQSGDLEAQLQQIQGRLRELDGRRSMLLLQTDPGSRAELALVQAEFDGLIAKGNQLSDTLAHMQPIDAAVDASMRQVTGLANKLGFEIAKVGPAFVSLANSTKGTAAQGKITQDVFEGMLDAAAATGRSTEDLQGGLVALSQMAGKGVVSMEELRQQLGERLPGAMQIAARGMNMTVAQLNAKVATGTLDATTFLTAFSAELKKEFGPEAEKAGMRPAAAFARLKNSIFLARAEVADGGLAKGLAILADSATRLVDRLSASGRLSWIGDRIGSEIARLPQMLAEVGRWITFLRVEAAEWWRQMLVATGVDMTGWSQRTSDALGWVGRTLLQLAFDIPGVIYALRQAFAGNDGNVAQRYQWVLPLRDFIQNQLMPVIAKVPGAIQTWAPIFLASAKTILDIFSGIRWAMEEVFGKDLARKIEAFLIIGRVTGMLSMLFGAISSVATAFRLVFAAVQTLQAGMALLFSPAGLVVAAIVAVAALAYVVYKNWGSIKAFLVGIWDGVKAAALGFYDGLKSVWDGVTAMLTAPFELAKKAISLILEGLKTAVENSPAGLIFRGGKWLIEQGAKAAGYATGGYVRGPGSTTSDSIPAMLSDREGIVNAQATAHYGGRAFIDGLNAMSFPQAGAAADVIQVSSGATGRPVTYVMPGVGSASGMADDDLADGMSRLFDRATAGRARQPKPRGHR